MRQIGCIDQLAGQQAQPFQPEGGHTACHQVGLLAQQRKVILGLLHGGQPVQKIRVELLHQVIQARCRHMLAQDVKGGG